MSIIEAFDVVSVISGSLALTLTYSWNTLIQDSIEYYYPKKKDSLRSQAVYTIILTVIISILLFYIIKYKTIIEEPIKTISNKFLI